jgi:hypothetical protein
MSPVAPPPPQPVNNPDIEEPEQMSVLQAVQMLNKAGYNPGKRFNRGFNAKSYRKAKTPPKSPSVHHHGYATANDNRDSLDREQKPSFVGTRRVAAPAPLVQESNNPNVILYEIKYTNNRARDLELNTDMRDELEMARDPTPRQLKIQQLEDNLYRPNGPLPPTPRRREEEPEFAARPTPTSQKPPQHFVPANGDSEPPRKDPSQKNRKEKEDTLPKEEKKEETVSKPRVENKTQSRPSSRSRSTQSRPSQSRSSSQSKKEKKGFMSGIKKGFGKLKNTVNEIDSQRIAEPTNSKKRSGSRREVRMA